MVMTPISGTEAGDSPALLARLEALDTCACSDAMDKLGLSGVASGLHPVTVRRKITGRVQTVQFAPVPGLGDQAAAPPAPPAAPGPVRHAGTAAIDAARPGDVIVVAADGRLDAAAWGGLLSLAATVRGVAGVIADGACRDVDEAIELELPVYARGVTPLTARGRQREVAWDVPIPVAGITVHPGDLVIADGSGVVFLPAEHAERVINAAEEVAAREQALSVRINNGEPSAAVLSSDYERMLASERDETRLREVQHLLGHAHALTDANSR
jgi:regulator of RNase E activity RraA